LAGEIADVIDAMIAEDFAGWLPPFDSAATVACTEAFAGRRTVGRPIGFPDCRIAAIVHVHGAAVATRRPIDSWSRGGAGDPGEQSAGIPAGSRWARRAAGPTAATRRLRRRPAPKP
jgi:hypothetical protein